jgi:hypothetical protein
MHSDLKHFKWFCAEREQIRLRKQAGESAPYTTDLILHRHRFTNIDRTDDTGTQILYRSIAELTVYEKILAVCIYRFSGSFTGHCTMFETVDSDSWQTWLQGQRRMFKMSAYQANWGRGKDRGRHFLHNTVFDFVEQYWHWFEQQYKTGITDSAECMCQILQQLDYPRMRFQSTECSKDLSYLFPQRVDPASQCALGPGARAGLQRMTENWTELQQAMPEFTPSVLEHALCEWNKWWEYYTGVRKSTNKIYHH